MSINPSVFHNFRMEKIPVFTGNNQDMDSWPTCGQFLSMIKDVAEKNDLKEEEIKELLKSKLDYKALDLILMHSTESVTKQMSILKLNFSIRLSIKEKVEVRKNLQQQETEPIEDFFKRCVHAQYLVCDDDCTVDATFDREVLLHFLIGLVPFVRDQVLTNTDCSTPEDFVLEAKKIFGVVKEEPIDDVPDVKVEVSDNGYKVYLNEDDLNEFDDQQEDDDDLFDQMLPLELKCDKCPKTFDSVKKFKLHTKNKHSTKSSPKEETRKKPKIQKEESDLKCEFCPDEFESVDLKDQHERTNHSNLSKICDKCDEEFPTFKQFVLHLAKVHCSRDDEGKTVCSFCRNFQSKNVIKVKNHILSEHFNCPNHKCKHCGKPFEELNRLLRHVKTAHLGEKPFHCDQCAKSFKSKEGLKNHYIVYHEKQLILKCEVIGCDKTFTNEVHRRAHQNNGHKIEPSIFVCDLCGKSFKRKESLKMHCLTTHSSKEEQDKHRFQCKDPDCDYSSLSKKDTEVHYKRLHLKIKNFLCTFCPKSYFKKSVLDEHINGVHLLKKPLQCNMCDYATAYKSKLFEHKKVSHGNQRFDCK